MCEGGPFQDYLARSLSGFGVDADVYGPFILSLCDDDAESELKELLAGLQLESNHDDWVSWSGRLLELYKDPALIPYMPPECQLPSESDVGGDARGVAERIVDAPHEDVGGGDGELVQEALHAEERYAFEAFDCESGEEEDPGYCEELEMLPEVSTDKLEALMESYPSCDPTSLFTALARCWDDVGDAAKLVASVMAQQATPVCRFYLMGQCLRSDCQFAHDTSSTTCAYWLRGSCAYEGQCPFLHDFSLEQVRRVHGTGAPASVVDTYTPPGALSSSEFPALPGRGADRAIERGGPPLQPVQHDLHAGIRLPSRTAVEPRLSAATSTSAAAGQVRAGGGSDSVRATVLDSKRRLEELWAQGGDAVRKQYEDARMEAAAAAKARNVLLMQATEAFRRGDKAAARSLSQRGRELNAVMRERHREAALRIFASRNQPIERVFAEGLVDLHGLHVSEATELLDCLLADMARARTRKTAVVVTGTGHHSAGRSKLFPAVESYLVQAGVEYRTIADRKGFKGAFVVNVADWLS